MKTLKTRSTVALAVVSAVGAALWAPSASMAAASQACSLRTDGLYFTREPGKSGGLRLWADGTVAYAPGPLEDAKRSLALRARGATDTGHYRVDGCNLHIEIKDVFGRLNVRSGAIEGSRLKLVFEARPGFNDAFKQEFEFEPAPFETILKEYLAQRQQTAQRQTAPPQLSVGSATMDSGCTKVSFEGSAKSASLPAGAKALAIELTGSFPPVTVTGGPICRAPGLAMRTCNQYGIVQGQPELFQQTTIVACKDARPFAPGKYVVRAGAASVPLVIK